MVRRFFNNCLVAAILQVVILCMRDGPGRADPLQVCKVIELLVRLLESWGVVI